MLIIINFLCVIIVGLVNYRIGRQAGEEDEKARLDKLNNLYENYLKGNQDLNAVSEQQKLDLQKQRDLSIISPKQLRKG